MFQRSPSRSHRAPVIEICGKLNGELIRSRWQHVQALLEVAEMSGFQMQLESTLSLLSEKCCEIVPCELLVTYFWNDSQEAMRVQDAKRLPAKILPVLEESNPLTDWLLEHGRPVLARRGEHPKSDELLHNLQMEGALATPIFVNGRVMGSWQLFSSSPARFSIEDAQLLWTLSRIAENLVSREFASRGLIRFAFTDHLTNLKTRGFFEQQLELEVKRYERNEQSFSLLMLDIDHFKRLNDDFGHAVGDVVLRQIGETLMQDMRDVDTVARYGGEEFVIILPDTGEQEAMLVAERIRAAVEERDFLVRGQRQPLSISVGLAIFGVDTKNKQELVRFADKALYCAKAQGRNRVVRYQPESKRLNAS
jgi:diguanylate cyclase (GGDEF)-like protein